VRDTGPLDLLFNTFIIITILNLFSVAIEINTALLFKFQCTQK